MLQLAGMPSRFRENVGHKSRRYRNKDVPSHMDVGSQPVCDVTELIPDIACIARTNKKPIRQTVRYRPGGAFH